MALCLGRLVVTSLRNHPQMHLMFPSNDSLQDSLHADAYQLAIINVVAAHVRLVIFPRYLSFHQKLSKQQTKM